MKQSEFLNALELAIELPSAYNNKPGYNLGYHWADGHFSYDCWNLIKVALTGRLGTNPVGTNIAPTVTGDLTGLQLLQRCTARSRNFSKLAVKGTYLYLERDPHSGIYIGDKVVNGHTVNVIECTKGWRQNGVVYSYVDASGRRFNYKGGKQCLAWSEHGLLTEWVEYDNIPEVQKYTLDKFRADVCSILHVDSCTEAYEEAPKISRYINKHNALVTPLERYFTELGIYSGKIEADEGNKPDFGTKMYYATMAFQRDYVGSKGKDIDGVISHHGYTWDTLLRK